MMQFLIEYIFTIFDPLGENFCLNVECLNATMLCRLTQNRFLKKNVLYKYGGIIVIVR